MISIEMFVIIQDIQCDTQVYLSYMNTKSAPSINLLSLDIEVGSRL